MQVLLGASSASTREQEKTQASNFSLEGICLHTCPTIAADNCGANQPTLGSSQRKPSGIGEDRKIIEFSQVTEQRVIFYACVALPRATIPRNSAEKGLQSTDLSIFPERVNNTLIQGLLGGLISNEVVSGC